MNFVGIIVYAEDILKRFGALILILFFENIPQFCISVEEIFDFGFTLNIVQAASPLLSVFMIYKTLGPIVGQLVYVSISCYVSSKNADRECPKCPGIGGCCLMFSIMFLLLSIAWILPMLLPQHILSKYMAQHMKDIPENLYEIGLYREEDPNDVFILKEDVSLVINLISFTSVIGGIVYILLFADKNFDKK